MNLPALTVRLPISLMPEIFITPSPALVAKPPGGAVVMAELSGEEQVDSGGVTGGGDGEGASLAGDHAHVGGDARCWMNHRR